MEWWNSLEKWRVLRIGGMEVYSWEQEVEVEEEKRGDNRGGGGNV